MSEIHKIRILVFFAVLFVCGRAEAQGLARGGQPKPTEIRGFSEAFCVALPARLRVCKARDKDTPAWEPRFVIERSGKILHSTDANLSVNSTTEDFFGYWGDLDRNGKKEVIVSDLENVTFGIGISTSRVRIFEEAPGPAFKEKFSFPIQEFGENGNFVYDRRLKETLVLLTYWSYFDVLDKKRVTGLYLVGKWFRFRGDRLEPVYRKPTLARRYLTSFQNLRGLTWRDPSKPYSWLKSKNTHRFFVLPEDRPIETFTGRIVEFTESDFTILTESGKSRRFALDDLTDFGYLPKRYIFPDMNRGYDPQLFFGKVAGKRVRLETYARAYGQTQSRLWFIDR